MAWSRALFSKEIHKNSLNKTPEMEHGRSLNGRQGKIQMRAVCAFEGNGLNAPFEQSSLLYTRFEVMFGRRAHSMIAEIHFDVRSVL